MKMKCNECGEIFDEYEADSKKDYMDYEGHWYLFEEYMVCPHCHYEGIEEYYEVEDDE